MASLTTPSSKSNEIGSFRKLLSWLIDPPAAMTDSEQRRQYSLLASLLIVISFVDWILPMGILPYLSDPVHPYQTPIFILASMVAVSFITAYVMLRIGYYGIGAVLMVGTFILAPYLALVTDTTPDQAYRPLMTISFASVLLTSMLFNSRRALVITVLAAALCTLSLPFVGNGNNFEDVALMLTTFSVISLLTWVFDRYRNVLENDRQQAISGALTRAESANTALEENNRELARANALIKENVRLKSEFMATMSHELRTPLNAIRGFTSIILEGMGGQVDEEASRLLTRVDANGERLLGLINDVLDIAKIESGRMELVYEPLDVPHLAEQWRSQMSVLAEQKGLAFEVKVAADLPEKIYGDSQRVTQVATNLLSNAFKFTKEGKVVLDVGKEDENWTIRVTDTGIGIPPHALNYIFEEFRQVDGSSKREYGGTGLGLAIVRNLCRTMNGSIKVSSELGKGSVFTVILPLLTEAELVPAA